MTYEQILLGLHSLKASDFDHNNEGACGAEKLSDLMDALMSVPSPQRATPELFGLMERLPKSDLGSPGPLVHTLEKLPGFEAELVKSVVRYPTELSVWMINRILNAELSSNTRKTYLALLESVTTHPKTTEIVRNEALRFLAFQARKNTKQGSKM
jgi:hypothetical protein